MNIKNNLNNKMDYIVSESDYGDKTKKEFESPLVTISIPTFNNIRTIKKCLNSIIMQDYPKIEIIIVDGDSWDGTSQAIKEIELICHKLDHIKRFEVLSTQGKLGEARQIGIEESKGEFIALFDSDIYLPTTHWLYDAISLFHIDESISTVWPLSDSPDNANWISKCYSAHSRIILQDRIKKKRGVMGGGNSLFRRQYIIEVGGMDKDVHWGEDYNLAIKLRNGGHKVIHFDQPLIHDNKVTIDEYVKKQFAGAEIFSTQEGLTSTGLKFHEIIVEQFGLGFWGMLKGMPNGEYFWLVFPFLLITKTIIFSRQRIINMIKVRK